MFQSLQKSEIVKNLIIINVLFFLATMVFHKVFRVSLEAHLAIYYIDSPFFKPWQLVTHMFMHGSMAHIFFNMYALFLFGSILERVWGAKRFLLFYLSAGLGAVLIHLIAYGVEVFWLAGTPLAGTINESMLPAAELGRLHVIYGTPMLGASGAIMGVLVAFAFLFPNTQLLLLFPPMPIKAKYLISLFILFDVVMLFTNVGWDNIAHFAHLGGAFTGFLMVKFWQRKGQTFY